MRPPFVTKVPIGPSLTKLALDLLMVLTILRRVSRTRYDAIHSHEEMGLIGVGLSRVLGIPHLYDMHSSLPQQLSNFKYSRSGSLRRMFEWAEARMVHGSRVVITICQELQDTVEQMGVGERALLIENVMGGDVEEPSSLSPRDVRRRWHIRDDAPMVLYTGTFESYQGVDLLIHASAQLARTHPHVRVLVVGGEPAQVDAARALARSVGAVDAVVFTGQEPASEIPAYIGSCDLLVSPRIRGTNTPLKIYSYLRSGKPIVATDLLTHTQVLTPEVARLVPVDAGAVATAIADLIDRPDERARLAGGAARLAATRYSRDAYLRQTAKAYARLSGIEPAGQADDRGNDHPASESPPGNARSVSASPDWARR